MFPLNNKKQISLGLLELAGCQCITSPFYIMP